MQFTVEANGDVVENKQVKRGRKQGQAQSYCGFQLSPVKQLSSSQGHIVYFDADTTAFGDVLLDQQELDLRLSNPNFTPGTLQTTKPGLYSKRTLLLVNDELSDKIFLVNIGNAEEAEDEVEGGQKETVTAVTEIFSETDCDIADFNVYASHSDPVDQHTNKVLVLCKEPQGTVYITEPLDESSSDKPQAQVIVDKLPCLASGSCKEMRSISFNQNAAEFYVAVGHESPTEYKQHHVHGFDIAGNELPESDGRNLLRLEDVGGAKG